MLSSMGKAPTTEVSDSVGSNGRMCEIKSLKTVQSDATHVSRDAPIHFRHAAQLQYL